MLVWRLILQIPRVITVILRENWLLRRLVEENAVDVVISDNRFGLFHHRVKTIYITHQLSFETGNPVFNRIAASIHHWFIKKYSCCWVPDFEKEPLAGNLSRTSRKIKHLRYIGCLSRFEKIDPIEKKYDLLVLISGPEPQRTIFENLILDQTQDYPGVVLLVRGLPADDHIIQNKQSYQQNIIFKNHVNGHELCILMQQSKLVICRSGYTSVMDLLKIRQKAVLIPTPGQPEQEYLARYLSEKKAFYTVRQRDFKLAEVVSWAKNFDYQMQPANMTQYIKVISDLLMDEMEIKH